MSSKDSKTSKTARVMNLLSKKQDAAQPETESSQPVSPIISSISADATVSVQIKNALEEALETELNPRQTDPEPEAVSVPVPPPAAKPAPVQPQPAPPEPDPEPEPESRFEPELSQEDDVDYVNVMQVLVREKAPKYIRMFGLCTCRRCQNDVEALTLNHLPPKYVVMSSNERIPKLTFYEGRYNSDITAQLLKACNCVMQRPHHER